MNNKLCNVFAFILLTASTCQPTPSASSANAGEITDRSTRVSTKVSTKASTKVCTKAGTEASTKSSTKVCTKASTEASTKASTKVCTKASPTAKVTIAFNGGFAETYTPAQLITAGVFKSAPLVGGTRKRTEAVKYIVLHSTETESPADAQRVVRSWNNRGKSHPGAQYLVDRDGSVYQTVSPEITTMHVNAFKTRFGVNNSNSIGIEIVRSGKQTYTPKQLKSITCLCLYLQKRFDIADEKVVGHYYVQPSDRTDPVGFNWQMFAASKTTLNYLATKERSDKNGTSIASAVDTGRQPPNKKGG